MRLKGDDAHPENVMARLSHSECSLHVGNSSTFLHHPAGPTSSHVHGFLFDPSSHRRGKSWPLDLCIPLYSRCNPGQSSPFISLLSTIEGFMVSRRNELDGSADSVRNLEAKQVIYYWTLESPPQDLHQGFLKGPWTPSSPLKCLH